MNSKQVMNHAADNIRILAASMVEKAKSGHIFVLIKYKRQALKLFKYGFNLKFNEYE